MFCPDCRAEYRPGFTHCVDCDVDLVELLPERHAPEPGPEETGPVIVFVTSDAFEAALVKSCLEASGVEVCLFDENISRIQPFYAALIGGIRVAVARDQEELAREVLAEYRGKAGLSPALGLPTPFRLSEESGRGPIPVENGEAGQYRCPACDDLLPAGATVCSKCGHEL
jgi:putative signal transducing protein